MLRLRSASLSMTSVYVLCCHAERSEVSQTTLLSCSQDASYCRPYPISSTARKYTLSKSSANRSQLNRPAHARPAAPIA